MHKIYSTRNDKFRNRAFSLTEIVIVVGVIGLVLGGIFWAASNMNMANQVRTMSRQLTAIVQNIRTIYVEQGGIAWTPTTGLPYAPVLTPILDQLNAFPTEMRQNPNVANGIIFHPWTQQVTSLGVVFATADDCTGGVSMANQVFPCFGIILNLLPTTACIQLLMNFPQTQSGLVLVYVTGNTTHPGITSFPISPATASADCDSTHRNNNIDMIFLLRDHQ